jgi:hypothetical protein
MKPLTSRQTHVPRLCAEVRTAKEIAALLQITPRTRRVSQVPDYESGPLSLGKKHERPGDVQ